MSEMYININGFTNSKLKSTPSSKEDVNTLNIPLEQIANYSLDKSTKLPWLLSDNASISISSTIDDTYSCSCSDSSDSCCKKLEGSISNVKITSTTSDFTISFDAKNLSYIPSSVNSKYRPSFRVVAVNNSNEVVVNLDNHPKMVVNPVNSTEPVEDKTDKFIRNGNIVITLEKDKLTITPTSFKISTTLSYKFSDTGIYNINEFFTEGVTDFYGTKSLHTINPTLNNGTNLYYSGLTTVSKSEESIQNSSSISSVNKKLFGQLPALWYKYNTTGKVPYPGPDSYGGLIISNPAK